MAAFALVKASSVVVVADPATTLLSARNQLAGTVVSAQPGAVNAEVEIDAGGVRIVAIVTQASARALGLAPGAPALGRLQGVERDRRRDALGAAGRVACAPLAARRRGRDGVATASPARR